MTGSSALGCLVERETCHAIRPVTPALRHSQPYGCRPIIGVAWRSGDPPVSTRLRHDALSFQRNVPEWPAVGGRSRHHCACEYSQDLEGVPRFSSVLACGSFSFDYRNHAVRV